MIPDDRPRVDQLKRQKGPFDKRDLDLDGGFNVGKWIARTTSEPAYREWYARNFWRKDWA